MRRRNRVLVTGGAGFLGSHLCDRLVADGNDVVCVDNLFTGSKDNIRHLLGNPYFEFVRHDVIQPIYVECDQIYNLACPASPVQYQVDPIYTTKTSMYGAMNALGLAKRCGARILQASTSEVYGDPEVSPQAESYRSRVNTMGPRACYDEGKRVAETLCADYRRQYGVDVRMVRIFNTYGPNMHPNDGRVISNLIMQALADKDLTLFGDGLQTRSFQYCDDLIEAIRRYMELSVRKVTAFFGGKKVGRRFTPAVPVINTGNPGEYTIRELAEETLRQLPGSKSKIVYRPLPSDDPKRRKPDIALAKALLGWEPKVPLAEGLARTIEYFKGRFGNA